MLLLLLLGKGVAKHERSLSFAERLRCCTGVASASMCRQASAAVRALAVRSSWISPAQASFPKFPSWGISGDRKRVYIYIYKT